MPRRSASAMWEVAVATGLLAVILSAPEAFAAGSNPFNSRHGNVPALPQNAIPRLSPAPNWEDVHRLVGGDPGLAAAVWDPSDRTVFAIAPGSATDPTSSFRTYTYANRAYTLLSPSTSPPRLGLLEYDAFDGYPLLIDTHTDPVTAWNFSGGTWHYVSSSTGPNGISNPAAWQFDAAYDPLGNGVVLVFAPAWSGQPVYTWKFSAGGWSNLTDTIGSPTGIPSGAYLGLGGDLGDGYLVLWVGMNLSDSSTWRLTNSAWVRVCSGCGPGGYLAPQVAYDSGDGYLLVIGGEIGGFSENETWSYHAGAWTLLDPSTPAPTMTPDSGIADDPPEGHMIIDASWVGGPIIHPTPHTWWYGRELAPQYRISIEIAPTRSGVAWVGDPGGAAGVGAGAIFVASPTEYLNASAFLGTNGSYAVAAQPAGGDCSSSHQWTSDCRGGYFELESATFNGAPLVNSTFVVAGAGGVLQLRFLPLAIVTAHAGSCGPIAVGPQSIRDGSGSLLPSLNPYPLAAATCSSAAFQGWASGGGVSVQSATSAMTNATVTSNGTLTAVYSSGIPGPTLSYFTATSDPVAVGSPTDLMASGSGTNGTPGYAFAHLPDFCSVSAGQDSISATCLPSTAGVFEIGVTLSDAAGGWATALRYLFVSPTTGGTTVPHPGTLPGTPGVRVALVIGGAAAAITGGILAGVVVRRMRRSPPKGAP